MNSNFFIAFLIFFTVLFQSACSAQAYRLSNINLDKNAQYGWSCAANSEYVATGGTTASYEVRGNQVKEGGKVILYKQLKGKWIVFQELTNPNMDDYGSFGNDVVMNDEYLVIAASGYSDKKVKDLFHREGIVYVYKNDPTTGKWYKRYSIHSPQPRKHGHFGKVIELKGDTLAVFYEKWNGYNDFPRQQCLSFYSLSTEDKKPFQNICLNRSGNQTFDFAFDFDANHLIIGRRNDALVFKKQNSQFSILDSINISSLLNIKGRITAVKLQEEEFFIGYHENFYDFWGYTPYTPNIENGDSVLKKTTINETTGKKESFILPNDDEILDKFNVTRAFFKKHAYIYESYESLSKRKGGAGVVLVYSLKNNRLNLNQKLTASERHADDWFGTRLVVSENNLLVGALGYPNKPENNADYKAKFSGAVFLFTRSDSGLWVEKEMYRSQHKRKRDKFGFSLNNWNNTFVIGSRFDQYSLDINKITGAVYILEIN